MSALSRVVALATVFVVALSIQTAAADPIMVVWDANAPAEEVLGYLVTVSDKNGNILLNNLNIGNQTFYVFPDAIDGEEYFFAIAAYNSYGVGADAYLTGFSDAPPTLVDPGDLASLLGDPAVLQLEGYDIYGDPVTFGATGLPPGMTLTESTGLIAGTPTTAGSYSVTITATDGLLTTSQNFYWYIDGVPPAVAITSPTALATYTTSVSAIGLGGTANDDVAIASVSWVNSRGGSGVATLTSATTWGIASMTLKVGDNVITVTAKDMANRTAIATLTVTFAGGAVPLVVIDTPTSAPTYSTSSTGLLMVGTAAPGLISMTWSSNRGPSGNVNFFKPAGANFTVWNVPAVPLQPGVNVITVSAQDTFEAIGTAVLTVTMNRAPVITNPGAQGALQGVSVTLPLTASDLDANTLTWSASHLPTGLVIDPSSGVVSGTPIEAGIFWSVITAFDGIASDSETVPWTVTAVPVTPMVTVADKPYDQTTSATLTDCTVAGVIAGHVVGCAGTASFDTSAAGTGKLVIASELMLTGADAGYYVLASDVAGTTASITPLPVTPVVAAAGKTYDATTTATLTSCTVTGALNGDVVACSGTVVFDTAAAGAGKPVSAVALWLTGAAAGNYFLATESATTTATISPRVVVPSATVADKAYDRTTVATLTGCTVTGAVGGDVVGCTGTAAFDTASAGNGKPVSITGLTLTGAAAPNYALSTTTASASAAITPLTVSPSVTAADKAYDGTTSATLTSCTLTGVLAGDGVSCTGTATFDTASAGIGKPVTASGLALTGAPAGNYVLSTTSAATTASISTVSVTPVVSVADKLYDRTAIATLATCTLSGAVGGDAVGCTGTAVFDSANVGEGKAVTVTGIALTGAAAGNYVLTSTTAATTAAITPLTVTPAVTVANKAYDRTTAAALTSCTVAGALPGDVVACTGTVAFDTASAGASKTVTASGLTLTGAAAGNYVLSSPTAATSASISPVTVTAAVAVANKSYDGTMSATLSSCTVTGAFGGDVVACTGSASFDSAGVGAAKAVSVNGLTLTGAEAGNYVLASTTATTTASISALSVTPVVAVSDKAYDGTSSAALTSCSLTGAIDGDVIGCSGLASFATASVGAGKTVNVSGIALTGAAAVNYVLESTTAATTASITALTLTPVVTASGKAYDGTTSATLASCTVTGAVAGDDVACSGSAAFATAAAGAAKTVNVSGIALTGTAAGNYALASTTASTTASITALTVTPVVAVSDKAYDGSTSATLTSCAVTGAIAGDVVACSGAASFATASVGAGKPVTVSGIALTGAAAANYVLGSTTEVTTATISALTVTPAVTASDKEYDGTASAALASCIATGALEGDVVTCTGVATFDSPAVGLGKTVTATGLTLEGGAAGNYLLASTTATTTAAITTRIVTPAVVVANKSYDGATSASMTSCTVTGAVGTEVVACTGSAAFDTAGIGTGKTVAVTSLSLTGADAANYALASTTATTTANIASLTVSPIVSAANKVYDGTVAATLTCSVTGAVAGDVVACAGSGAFATASVGMGKTVAASGLTLTGAGAANYALASTTAETTATITALTVTPVVAASNKAYDGTTTATLTSCTVTGAVAGDVVACTGAVAFDTASVGAGKTVAASGLTLTGAAAGNYELSSTSATTAASITALTVTPVVTAENKLYDGTTSASLTSCTVTGAIAGDVVACTGTAVFDNADAGTGKTVTVSGLALTGAAAGNYVLSSTTATTTATITNPDSTAPTLAVTTPTSTGTFTTPIETLAVSGTASDSVGVTQVSWTTNRGASGVATGTSAWSIAAVPLGAGNTVITVTARDAANNTTNATLTVNFVAPASPTLTAPTGTIATATPTFTWTAVSGATHYQLWVNDANETARINVTYAASAVGCSTVPGTCTISPGVTLAPGAGLWWVRPSNAAGVAGWGSGLSFTVPAPPDTTAPAVAVTTPTTAAAYPTTSGTLALGGTASDNVAVTQVSWATDRGTSGLATGTSAWTIAAMPLTAGTTIITVTARDAAGNTTNTTLTATYTPSPPGAVTLIAPIGTSANATPSFSWSASADATEYQLWVNTATTAAKINTVYSKDAAGCGGGTGTCTVSPGITLAAGTATWWIRPANAVGPGPWGPGATFTVPPTPDTTVPTVAVTIPSATGTFTATSGTVAVSGTAGDNVGVTTVTWSTDRGAGGTATGTNAWSIASVPLGAGTTTITVSARDAANNVANATLTVTFNVVTAPGAATLLAPTGAIATTTPTFSWTAVSNATEYQLWVNDATTAAKVNLTYSGAAAGCGAGTGTCSVSPGVALAAGSATWWIRTSNTAGGAWSTAGAITVPSTADTTVPILAITAPTGTGTYTSTGATLPVSGTASDNVGVTQVTWATDRGANGVATGTTGWSIASVPLGSGTTVISVTARDAANNIKTATLTVTYNAPVPPGAATLLAPTGTSATSTPSFSWTAVSGATEYLLWVNDAATGAKIVTTYSSSAVGCGSGTGTCAVSPGVTLASGVAVWWIRPSNAAGAGPWGSGATFTVAGAADTAAPVIAMTAPTSTGTYLATSGTLAVSGTAGDNVAVTQVTWSTNNGASGVATGTTAWSIPSVPLGAGTTVITVVARDAANNTAITTLSVTFTLPLAPPGAATLLAPSGAAGTTTPSFSWAAVSDATEYLLWVNDAATAAKINIVYSPAAAGCGAGTGTCTVSPGVPLAHGAATWWIRTSNSVGGTWSTAKAITVP